MKPQGKSMDKETGQVVAGTIGAIIGTDWWDKTKVKSIGHGVISVIAGAGSAVYLTPLIAKQMGWNSPEQVVGLAFAVGTLGLRSVQIVNAIAEAALKKIQPT